MRTRLLSTCLFLALVSLSSSCASDPATVESDRTSEPVVDRSTIPATPTDTDVLVHLARYPGTETQHAPDGTTRVPKYGSADLEEAERALVGVLPRPWTAAVLREAWIDASRLDDTTGEVDPSLEARRAALITLLAAGRDESVLPLVGASLTDSQLHVRVAATYALLDYWAGYTPPGGTESAMYAAQEWWTEYQSSR